MAIIILMARKLNNTTERLLSVQETDTFGTYTLCLFQKTSNSWGQIS